MILDTSALVAILVQEPGHEPLAELVLQDPTPGIGAPTLVEAGLVLAARIGRLGPTFVARFLEDSDAVVIPFGDDHWHAAVDAFVRYGKGRHPAALNLGDCLTYAVARVADEPLLSLGDDFAHTDLRVLPS